jgi:hypothetical protein
MSSDKWGGESVVHALSAPFVAAHALLATTTTTAFFLVFRGFRLTINNNLGYHVNFDY